MRGVGERDCNETKQKSAHKQQWAVLPGHIEIHLTSGRLTTKKIAICEADNVSR